MKKGILLSFLLSFAAISFTSAQDLNKILDKHYKAVGQKNILKVNSMQATGNAVMMGMENPFEMKSKRPDKLLVIVEYQGAQIKQAYDGETAWMINPMMGSSTAVTVSGPEADGLKESADMDGLLWKYEEKGHKIDLEEPEEVNGKKVFVLKLSKKNGKTDYYYIDQESYLLVKVKSKSIMNGAEVDVDNDFSDFREVNGYLMPFTIVQKAGGQTFMTLKLTEVKMNVELDDAVFSKPE